MAGPVTRYVVLLNSKVYQVNNVVSTAISSVTVTDGTYRDQPPVVVGGAAISSDPSNTQVISASIAGGAMVSTTVVGSSVEALGTSSVVEDDTYTHVAPRDYIAKVALLVFTTSDGITTYDCFFKLAEVAGVFNAAPQGWSPTQSQ